MDKWKVVVDKKKQVHVKMERDGNFSSCSDATTIAKNMAQQNKTLLFIHDEEGTETLTDYTNFLSLGEMKLKLQRDLKTAEVELVVAKSALNKWRNAYHAAITKEDRENKKKRYLEAKQRVVKSKFNVKNAKKKYDSFADNFTIE